MSEKTEKKEGFFKKIFNDKKKRLIFIICAAVALILIAGGIIAKELPPGIEASFIITPHKRDYLYTLYI